MVRHRRQRGQSLVEAVVLAAAVVPLFLAVPLLAKYQDLGRAAIAASRSAAFECSVRPEDCAGATPAAFADDLRRRHFGRPDRDLLSNGAMMDEPAGGSSNRFWVDRRGQGLLASFEDVSVDVAAGHSDAVRGAWLHGAGPVAGMPAGSRAVVGAAAPGAFGLALENGLVTAGVSAGVSLDRTLAQWLQQPQGMALALRGRTAVLVDAWNASSAKGGEATSLQARVERGWRLPGLGQAAAMFAEAGRSSPAGELGEMRGADAEEIIDGLYSPIRTLITSPMMAPVEPRGSLFRYHEIDVEIVPGDRLETAP
jgi:hypothetical protein